MKKEIIAKIDKNDPDLKILCKHTGTSPKELRDSTSADSKVIKRGNYIRTGSLRYWEKPDIKKLEKAIEKANKEAKNHRFELMHVTDYEEDDDRTWQASFSFLSHKK